MVLILTSIYVSYAFGIMFGVCEIGQRVSNGFDKIGGEIEVFNWHLFSQSKTENSYDRFNEGTDAY